MSEAKSGNGNLIWLAVLAFVIFLFLNRCETKRNRADLSGARACTNARSAELQRRSPDGTLSDAQIKAVVDQCLAESQRRANSN